MSYRRFSYSNWYIYEHDSSRPTDPALMIYYAGSVKKDFEIFYSDVKDNIEGICRWIIDTIGTPIPYWDYCELYNAISEWVKECENGGS